jgi:hypothetical protein
MPFNVQILNDGRVYVAWTRNAYEIDEPTEEIPGEGRIVAYDRHGNILQDYTADQKMNNPWGMAIAPSNFGELAGALLVANFGDGTIAAYDVATGADLGYVKDPKGDPVVIDGIWGLTFGNGVSLGDSNALYFTAGPDEERDGLFGSLRFGLSGDADLDGDVDVADLGILASNWQQAGDWRMGDFDGNGSIDVNDLGLLAENWPSGPEAAPIAQFHGVSVPEPALGVLGPLGLAASVQRMRRRHQSRA